MARDRIPNQRTKLADIGAAIVTPRRRTLPCVPSPLRAPLRGDALSLRGSIVCGKERKTSPIGNRDNTKKKSPRRCDERLGDLSGQYDCPAN